MGLFTSLVFNNGTAHTFVEKGQIPSSSSIVREYIEPAAAQAARSKLTVKHDLASKTVNRSLLQRTVNVVGSDGVLYPITVNFTVTFNKLHNAADVVLEQKLLAAAVADTTFHANFVNGLS
jgi:hypothetical protein